MIGERTRQIQEWLELRYQQGLLEGGEYKCYSPVYGLQLVGKTETGNSPAMRYCMMLQVMRTLDVLKPRSVLDVGCAEGFIARKAHELFGCAVVGVEMAVQACRRAGETTGITALCGSADALPFADNSFDVVVMTEVLEHLENPFHALAECWRVAKKGVLVTTQEFLPSRMERWVCMGHVNHNADHAERNYSHASDWRLLFGNGIFFLPQGCYPKLLRTPFDTQNPEQAREALLCIVDHPLGRLRYFGMTALIPKTGETRRAIGRGERSTPDHEMVDRLFSPGIEALPTLEKLPKAPRPVNRGAWAGRFDPLTHLYEERKYLAKRIRNIEARRRWLAKPRRVGTWGSHTAQFLTLMLHERRQAVNTRDWLMQLGPKLADFLRHTLWGVGAWRSGKIEFEVGPKVVSHGERELKWEIDCRSIPGATGFSLFVEKLNAGKNLRDIPHTEPYLFDTVYPKTGFPTRGRYRVWAVAMGKYGKHLGEPSNKEVLEIV
jgi:SAM-dependent methyltransferase